MAARLFSPSWHSVASLRPKLASGAKVVRHVYRGKPWFVVQDRSGGRHYRLSPAAHALVCRMDGKRTAEALWKEAGEEGGPDACTQSELVDLLVQLSAADLLQVDATPDAAALFERRKKKRRDAAKQYLLNPLSIKLPLLDPAGFLDWLMPHIAWCFSRKGLLLWLALVLPAFALAVEHWQALTSDLSGRALSGGNLLALMLVFPAVKLFHELGHACAVRAFGGQVHEMGLMFLVFAPVPYVEASAAAAFPSRWQRALAAAAGMIAELLLASLALFAWLAVEPGIVRAVAWNTMFIAGVSTLVVNGNPLLRYDGYYILCDLAEMPNLAQRGQKYLAYLWDRYAFGAADAEPPKESPAEKRWLVAYTPLAWCYRVFVLASIIWFVAGKFFIFGVIAALWGFCTLACLPLAKAWRHVAQSPVLRHRRKEAARLSLSLAAAALIFLFAVPMPLRRQAEGVVWLPDKAILRAGGNGFFMRWLAMPGQRVQPGEKLFVLEDRPLAAELATARAKVDEASARLRIDAFSDPAKAQVEERKLHGEEEILARLQEREARLAGVAQSAGVLAAAGGEDMPGRYFKKGELVGYVLRRQSLVARIVVPQDDIHLVRTHWRGALLRFADDLEAPHAAQQARLPAGAVEELPSPALGIPGGGWIPVRPDDPDGVHTLARVFLLDLALPPGAPPAAFGERVFVRFDLGFEPLGWQALRRLRQLLLGDFGV